MRVIVVSVCANVWQHILPPPKLTIQDICLLGIYQRLCGWRVICNYIHVPRHKRRTHKHTHRMIKEENQGESERIPSKSSAQTLWQEVQQGERQDCVGGHSKTSYVHGLVMRVVGINSHKKPCQESNILCKWGFTIWWIHWAPTHTNTEQPSASLQFSAKSAKLCNV